MRGPTIAFPALVLLGGVLGCSASPATVTSAPRIWPVPTLGSVAALRALDDGLLIVEEESSTSQARRISRVAAEGGLPSLIAFQQAFPCGAPLVAGDDAFWVAGQPAQVRVAPRDGGEPPRVLVTMPGVIDEGLAVDATHVYFGYAERAGATWTRSLMRVLRSGGTPEVVESCASACTPIAVVDGLLYVRDSDAIRALSLSDRSSVELASGLRPARAIVRGDDLYVIARPSSDSAADGALFVVPREGGTPRKLVDGIRDPITTGGTFADLALGPAHVVLLDRLHEPDPEIVIVRRADAHVEHRTLSQSQPSRIAVDERWIYIATLDGSSIDRERLDP